MYQCSIGNFLREDLQEARETIKEMQETIDELVFERDQSMELVEAYKIVGEFWKVKFQQIKNASNWFHKFLCPIPIHIRDDIFRDYLCEGNTHRGKNEAFTQTQY